MPVRLTIPTDDLRIAFDLVSANGAVGPGAAVTTGAGGVLRFEGATRPSASGKISLAFDVEAPGGAAADDLADWLYDRLKGRVSSVRIARHEVPVEREELRRALAR
ncbi:MAG TPA: hypothetical protein VFS40_00550 [Gemmatimonadales bacterium]|nr:hypothetical protein [Gemmatimonadales bacterium]